MLRSVFALHTLMDHFVVVAAVFAGFHRFADNNPSNFLGNAFLAHRYTPRIVAGKVQYCCRTRTNRSPAIVGE